MASAFSISPASRWWSRCPISASAIGSTRRPITGPTASPISAPCTARSPASTCWSAPAGTSYKPDRHHRGFPQLDQDRHHHPARVSAGRQGRQRGAPAVASNRSWPTRCLSSTAGMQEQGLVADLLSFPWIKLSNEEWHWVDPASFFDVLPQGARCLPAAPRRGGALCAGALGARCGARRPHLAHGAEDGGGRGRRDAGRRRCSSSAISAYRCRTTGPR